MAEGGLDSAEQGETPNPDPAPTPARRGRYDRPLEGGADRLGAWVNMLLVDHGVIRLVHLNRAKVGSDAYRSAQPAPHQLRRFARIGVKTVVNLRGGRNFGSYPLEKEACASAGMAFEELVLRSRAAPTRETLAEAAALLGRIAYPALFHCKAGADRAGLMSALYMIVHEGAPVREAKRQLSLRFGHFKQGKTGVLDAFLDAAGAAEAAAEAAGRSFDFLAWAATDYDPDAVTRSFRATSWGAIVTDTLLRRE